LEINQSVKEKTCVPMPKQAATDADQANRDSDETWLGRFEEIKGQIPPPLSLMALRSGTVSAFMAHRNRILEGGPLTEKEKALLGVSVSVALKSSACIRNHANDARKAGAGEDEIVQAALIAGLICGTSPLRAAYAGIVNSSND
jgi:AhpD family alkylhydroperoxidase